MSVCFKGLSDVGPQWAEVFRAHAVRTRTPISAVLELTQQCNLRCRHCYLGNQEKRHRQNGVERDTKAIMLSLDEWAEAGVLYLLITGGDPLIREDFSNVYRHARELGMLVTVFCNGMLVTDRILSLFRELPPRWVEISLFGATPETYERVTQSPGSYAKAWGGIHRLRDNGIHVGLKTVLLTLNRHELEAMERQANELGLAFRYDAAVFPCLSNGSHEPLAFRVCPSTVVMCDVATPERRRIWRERIDQTAVAPESDDLYTCGAGATGFFADSCGRLSPCLMATHYRYKQGTRGFREVWENDLGELRRKRKTRSDTTFSGPWRGACTHCPAMNHLETGDEEQESDYMRETARQRYWAVMR